MVGSNEHAVLAHCAMCVQALLPSTACQDCVELLPRKGHAYR